MAELSKIVSVQIDLLRGRLAERKISLEVDETALKHLAETGFDPVYGARPLKRVLQSQLADPLAMRILEGEIKEGAAVRVTAKDKALAFNT
jgi:ATP-dependent Clp protease ATP-binding subunit ClpB